jgi:hypothetical protein
MVTGGRYGPKMESGVVVVEQGENAAVGSRRARLTAPIAMVLATAFWPALAGAVPAPTAGVTAPSSLSAVSCPTLSSCMAVGTQGLATTTGLAEQWDGDGWTVMPTPSTGVADTTLAAVSCSAPGACSAVGSTQPGQGLAYPGSPLVERWDGTAWTIQAMPLPSGSNLSEYLTGVSCPSAQRCVAVGFYSVNGEGTGTVAADWNGASWSLQTFPYPSAELLGVSCAAEASCTAVGQFGGQTAADHWNGTTWTALRPPNPTTPQPGDGLVAVGCTSDPTRSCQSVGEVSNGDFGVSTFGAGWNGRAWTVESTPSPSNHAALLGVSCGTVNACVAVGGHPVSGVGELPLIGVWNGTGWTSRSGPLVRGTLDGVSCSDPSACTAVGLAQSQGGGLPLIERWNGTSWRQQAP